MLMQVTPCYGIFDSETQRRSGLFGTLFIIER